jgi:hypothetical protein
MSGSPSAIISMGFGTWGSPGLVLTLGYGIGAAVAETPTGRCEYTVQPQRIDWTAQNQRIDWKVNR